MFSLLNKLKKKQNNINMSIKSTLAIILNIWQGINVILKSLVLNRIMGFIPRFKMIEYVGFFFTQWRLINLFVS